MSFFGSFYDSFYGDFFGTAVVDPDPPVLTTITVSPATATVAVGGTRQFTASQLDQYGDPIEPAPITWSVDGDGSIDESGLYTAGGAAGSATISATVGSVSGSATVTVTAPTPSEGYPAQSDVLAVVVYGPNGEFVGTNTGIDGGVMPDSPELVRLRLTFVDEAGRPWQDTPVVTKLIGKNLVNDSMIAHRGEYERTNDVGFLEIDRLKGEIYDFELIRPDGTIATVRRQLPQLPIATFSDTIFVN